MQAASGIDTAGFTPTLLVPHKVSCAIRQFVCNKEAHLLGEQSGMLLYSDTTTRLIYVGGKPATNKSALSVDQFLHKSS